MHFLIFRHDKSPIMETENWCWCMAPERQRHQDQKWWAFGLAKMEYGRPWQVEMARMEADSNVNKSFMNNSSDTESSHSSDFGDLLKPKKRRTHKWLLMFKASLNGVNLLCHFKMSLIVNIAASKQINVNFEIKMGYLVQAAMRS